MFTGIITHTGRFQGYRRGGRELLLEAPPAMEKPAAGESLAVNGVCLSLARSEGGILAFDLSQETLSRTTLGSLRPGERLNLEPPLTLNRPLSGHLVSGHIDGTCKVSRAAERPGGGRRVTLIFPAELRPYFIPKGSVALDGISLTLAGLTPSSFDVELIPVTLAGTNAAGWRAGRAVNLECDMIGKYVYNWTVLRNKS